MGRLGCGTSGGQGHAWPFSVRYRKELTGLSSRMRMRQSRPTHDLVAITILGSLGTRGACFGGATSPPVCGHISLSHFDPLLTPRVCAQEGNPLVANQADLLSPPVAHSGGVDSLLYTHDGNNLLSSGADCRMRLWDPDTCELVIANYGTFPHRRCPPPPLQPPARCPIVLTGLPFFCVAAGAARTAECNRLCRGTPMSCTTLVQTTSWGAASRRGRGSHTSGRTSIT